MKYLLLAGAAAFLLAPMAFADTLNITSTTDTVQPAGKISSKSGTAFNPGTNKIIFKALGKTCTLNSSGNPWNAGAGAGCNYEVTIDNSAQTINLTSNGKGCTVAADVPAACK
ncbi:hypothetical protein FHS83_000507 [Rhizomicrobium palustre]|uniref:Uncharacterized protein n=1 Tax=Rhizomicrobium palustre TaxID=189966 RepID=A0A846MVE6_9PROT|nr:hypothetical protein [Rhizomicrobium palustre]NIK87189.1 hypothetical protein [Rhizomicrobium palustre]